MLIPSQEEPVDRHGLSTGRMPTGEIAPQACWCLDPDPPGSGYTWWCEMGHDLIDSGADCAP